MTKRKASEIEGDTPESIADESKEKPRKQLSAAEIEAIWASVARRDLITAQEVTLFYLPISSSALHHGECGTHVLTRVTLLKPQKERGRTLFIKKEVEEFCRRHIDTAQKKNRRTRRPSALRATAWPSLVCSSAEAVS